MRPALTRLGPGRASAGRSAQRTPPCWAGALGLVQQVGLRPAGLQLVIAQRPAVQAQLERGLDDLRVGHGSVANQLPPWLLGAELAVRLAAQRPVPAGSDMGAVVRHGLERAGQNLVYIVNDVAGADGGQHQVGPARLGNAHVVGASTLQPLGQRRPCRPLDHARGDRQVSDLCGVVLGELAAQPRAARRACLAVAGEPDRHHLAGMAEVGQEHDPAAGDLAAGLSVFSPTALWAVGRTRTLRLVRHLDVIDGGVGVLEQAHHCSPPWGWWQGGRFTPLRYSCSASGLSHHAEVTVGRLVISPLA